MHGMLSASILIALLAVIAAACLYAAVRMFAAGRVPGPAAPAAAADTDPESS
jgi:hypothetical protein